MGNNIPAENIYVFDLSSLKKPEISVFTAWDDRQLMGMGLYFGAGLCLI